MAAEFLRKYPNSNYAQEARKLLARIDEKLAKKELEAAKLYFKFKEYNASVMSLEYILTEYPLAKETNLETNYYLGLCKMKLGELEEAQAIMEELSENQKWQKKAQKVLAKIKKELE
jgi:outer membrane protein assembly factor BamD